MGHPLFPHPEGLPPEKDDRDISVLYVQRDGKIWPDPFMPSQITDPSFFVKWGGGKYVVIARGSGGYVTARSQMFEIEGPPIPYVSPSAPANSSHPAAAPPSSAASGLQIFGAVASAVGAVTPLVLEYLRSNRESDQRREDRLERERREDRERDAERRREERDREDRQRREDREREEARHRETMTMMQQGAQNQLAVQATFSERLAAATKDAHGGSGAFKKDAFFDGVEFAKGMMENQGIGQMVQGLPNLIMALKTGGPPGAGAGMPRGFVGGPNFFGGAPGGPPAVAPAGPFTPPPGPPR